MERTTVVWTNQDLKKLRSQDLISIVGQSALVEDAIAGPLPPPYVKTQDPEWYAKQAAKLREELERRQAQLREYRQALDDARSLRKTSGGISLDEGDIGITPEAGIEILQQEVNEPQTQHAGWDAIAMGQDFQFVELRGL